MRLTTHDTGLSCSGLASLMKPGGEPELRTIVRREDDQRDKDRKRKSLSKVNTTSFLCSFAFLIQDFAVATNVYLNKTHCLWSWL